MILPGLSVVGSAEGQKLTLECIVESYPKPYVVWRRGDQILAEGDQLGHKITNTPLAMYRMASKLTLTSYRSSQAGIYKCVGTNSLGEAELTTRVYTTELVPPREPKYEIILAEEEEEGEQEEKEDKMEKQLSKKERRKKKRNRAKNGPKNNDWTLSDPSRNSNSEEHQEKSSHFPGLMSSGSSGPSLPTTPATSIFILALFTISILTSSCMTSSYSTMTISRALLTSASCSKLPIALYITPLLLFNLPLLNFSPKFQISRLQLFFFLINLETFFLQL